MHLLRSLTVSGSRIVRLPDLEQCGFVAQVPNVLLMVKYPRGMTQEAVVKIGSHGPVCSNVPDEPQFRKSSCPGLSIYTQDSVHTM